MAQLMPLPLTVSCFSKIQIGFTFLVAAHVGSPGKRAVKWVCVCYSLMQRWLQAFSNLTMTTRHALCGAMIFATVEKADTIVMNDGEELDSWCVILNGQVEVTRRNGTIELLQLGDRQAKHCPLATYYLPSVL